MSDAFRKEALTFHEIGKPGKLEVVATKPLATQRDLSLAYSPGVAAACEEIAADPANSYRYTARGNLVGVVSNGTAVLGLGAIGAEASKPVMEGKAVLFKKFAGIDSFDIEVDELDVEKFCAVVKALEPTFGAINLEDIKAPECFEIEKRLRERMGIPVFHDDQHGTAITVCAAIVNGLRVVDKKIEEVKLVASGAGAAALACLDLLVSLGLRKENVTVCDIVGVVYEGRAEQMDPYKARYARATPERTMKEAIRGADVFLGLSAPRVLTPEMAQTMGPRPIIMALANPTPEIMPDLAREARPDAVIATGRSDFPNQVNNVLCFPFIFRGALDCGATQINEEMKMAAVYAIADLAKATTPETVAAAYGIEQFSFGPDYLIPKPFDPRLIEVVPPAVAEAAAKTGLAKRPIEDLDAYRERLSQRVVKSGSLMKPIFARAAAEPQRLVFTDGEEPRVLRAVRMIVDEQLARPILIGRPEVVAARIARFGLDLAEGRDYELCNPDDDPRYADYVSLYRQKLSRRGVTPELAKEIVRTRRTVIAAIMVARDEADAMIAGPVGRYKEHLGHICDVLGMRADMAETSTLHAIVRDQGALFITDTYVSLDPDAEHVAQTTINAARAIRRFGVEPNVALVSHSNYGSRGTPSSKKMREALALVRAQAPDLAVDGEMHADAALNPRIRKELMPEASLDGEANLLVMPNLDAANIAYNIVKSVTGAISVGPILLGPAKSAHIVTHSSSARGVLNMAAVACVDAIIAKG